MTAFRSTRDAGTAQFAENREAMLAALEALDAEHAKALAGGGDKAVARHRKRGKLLDLNQLLRGARDRFPVKVGSMSALRRARFVIVLDSDTELPRDAARRLIGTIAHPLNRAVLDPNTNTVTEGYGILQPRVSVSTGSAARSWPRARSPRPTSTSSPSPTTRPRRSRSWSRPGSSTPPPDRPRARARSCVSRTRRECLGRVTNPVPP